ncbi:MAG: dihydroorotase [Candidatus Zixiibacteriota bacterium]|nr:MAG: dihydroorotase [candidate division Zixibacteria bacterium]
MKNDMVLAGGKIVDPATGYFGPATVFISDGKIEKVEKRKKSKIAGGNVIKLDGKIICPGFIDMHVHLREPGDEDEETIISGSEAAAAGGFTSIACMPNTKPPLDDAGAIEYVNNRALLAPVKVYPVGAVTVGQKGDTLTEMMEMSACGAVAFSDDGSGVQNNDMMRRALEYSKTCGVPVISHCEYSDLTASGVMHEGFISSKLGMKGIPAIAEELMVMREIMLASLTGARVHIAHVSTAGSVDLIRKAKKSKVPVTAEVTPHHFSMTDELINSFDTNLKVNPPLRTKNDVDAVIKGLADGAIDCVASDHAPHSIEDKELEFDYAPFGLIGLETALGLVITKLINEKILTWVEVVDRMSAAPARILDIPGGILNEGEPADITVIDPELEWIVNPNDFKSLSRNTPFAGWQLKGKAVMTIVDGNIVYSLI